MVPVIDPLLNKFYGTVNPVDICGFIAANSLPNSVDQFKKETLDFPVTKVLRKCSSRQ
jgi:hypothetical protein